MSRRSKFWTLLGVIVLGGLEADCATRSAPPVPLACQTERDAFDASASALMTLPPISQHDGYIAQATAPGAVERIDGDARALVAATAAVERDSAPLRTCRLARAATLDETHSEAAQRQSAAERAALAATAQQLRTLADATRGGATNLRTASDMLLQASPASRSRLMTALAAAPPSGAPFVARSSTDILAEPRPDGARIAGLRKGERVSAALDYDPAAPWVKLTLNDDSIGYVGAADLQPARPNPSAIRAAARASAARHAQGDPMVAMGLHVREDVPRATRTLQRTAEGADGPPLLASGAASPAAGTAASPGS